MSAIQELNIQGYLLKLLLLFMYLPAPSCSSLDAGVSHNHATAIDAGDEDVRSIGGQKMICSTLSYKNPKNS
uniref:Uncharacterized protein n=1 Tax=Oryza nivara TaxID=4536 RepID=A0A0E0FF91_ORYNI